MRVNGIIFDMDGTLLDSMGIWKTLGSDYLRGRGVQPEPGLDERLKTMSLRQAAVYFQENYGVAESVGEILDGVNRMIQHFYLEEVEAKPGAFEFLQRLAAEGVRMCVATATENWLAQAALKRNGLLSFFSQIFTCSDVGVGKDSPKIFKTARKALGTKKAETWVFEDALYAMKSARKAGLHIAAIADDSQKKDREAIRETADVFFRNYQEASEVFFQ